MQKKDEMHSNIFNDFINNISDNSHNNKKKQNNKRHSRHNNEMKYDKKNEDEDLKNNKNNGEEKIIQIKLIQLENEMLMKKIKEKDDILKNYQKQYNEQKYKILDLQKQIKEITNKEKNKNIFIPKEKKMNNIINDKFEESLAIKAVEEQIFNELNEYSNKINKDDFIGKNKIDRIENIKFNIDNTSFFQCGICMDTFQDGEQLKKLVCSHIYHKDCLNQWIQSKKDCPLCGKFINI